MTLLTSISVLPLILLIVGCSKETTEEGKKLASETPKTNIELPQIVKDKCIMCHDAYRRKVGPSFLQVKEKYKDDPEAIEKIIKSIKGGSQGKWGRIAMLPMDVSEEEAKYIAEWIMSLK